MMDVSNLILNTEKLALLIRMKIKVFIQNRIRRINKQFSGKKKIPFEYYMFKYFRNGSPNM